PFWERPVLVLNHFALCFHLLGSPSSAPLPLLDALDSLINGAPNLGCRRSICRNLLGPAPAPPHQVTQRTVPAAGSAPAARSAALARASGQVARQSRAASWVPPHPGQTAAEAPPGAGCPARPPDASPCAAPPFAPTRHPGVRCGHLPIPPAM